MSSNGARKVCIKALAAMMLLVLDPAALAGTIPADDAMVLAVLPTALVRHRGDSHAASAGPHDVAATLQRVRVYLDADADSGDARYLDQAENVLDAWSTRSTAELPVAILIARAEIAQRAHRFEQALNTLAVVIDREPDHVQARLMRAYVRMAQGHGDAALLDCERLRRASTQSAVNCVSRARGLTGEAGRAYQDVLLELTRSRHTTMSASAELRELSLTAADLAERLGLNDSARAHYRSALAMAPKSAFTLSAYADFLLAQNDAAGALALIGAADERLGLQVRRAIAAQRLGRADAHTLTDSLVKRFALMQQRGDSTATREHARFTLDALGDAPAALAAALGNWRMQREPEDALLVLRAARAAHDSRAAKQVSEWIAATRLEDVRLADLDLERRG